MAPSRSKIREREGGRGEASTSNTTEAEEERAHGGKPESEGPEGATKAKNPDEDIVDILQ